MFCSVAVGLADGFGIDGAVEGAGGAALADREDEAGGDEALSGGGHVEVAGLGRAELVAV